MLTILIGINQELNDKLNLIVDNNVDFPLVFHTNLSFYAIANFLVLVFYSLTYYCSYYSQKHHLTILIDILFIITPLRFVPKVMVNGVINSILNFVYSFNFIDLICLCIFLLFHDLVDSRKVPFFNLNNAVFSTNPLLINAGY